MLWLLIVAVLQYQLTVGLAKADAQGIVLLLQFTHACHELDVVGWRREAVCVVVRGPAAVQQLHERVMLEGSAEVQDQAVKHPVIMAVTATHTCTLLDLKQSSDMPVK
jgi:hypothetical protein